MGWNYLSISNLQRCNGYDYLAMLGLKLNHVSKRGYRSIKSCLCRFDNNIQAIIQFSKLSLGNPSSCCWLLTYWGREKWTPFRRRHFQMHFLECKFWISIKISLKFVPKCPINNIAAMVQIMAWRRPGDNSLSEPQWWLVYRHIYASLGLNELIVVFLCNLSHCVENIGSNL